jgi:hypothetical protein
VRLGDFQGQESNVINHPHRSKAERKSPVIDLAIAKKVLEIVDAGLTSGVGKPKPGQMCVEAAVCFALGLPHGDDPDCVSRALRSLKIRLNDAWWSSNEARAKGLRRLALIQLGSRDALDDKEFSRRVATLAIRLSVPVALRAAASIHKDPKHQEALREAANKCEREPTESSAREARSIAQAARKAAAADAADAAADAAAAAADAADAAAAADAADAAAAAADAADAAAAADAADAAAAADARDRSLADFAEGVVQILIAMNVPGIQWLPLTEAAA